MGFFSALMDFLFGPVEDETDNESKSEKKKNTLSNDSEKSDELEKKYVKNTLMSDCEKQFFDVFKDILADNYIIYSQLNLATIITKNNIHTYQNELYRNIDFAILDKETYSPLLLIEINDETHNYNKRKIRDYKVKRICEEADIPLIFFWTKFGINRDYIEKRLKNYLDL